MICSTVFSSSVGFGQFNYNSCEFNCVVDFIFLVYTETYFPFIITEVDVFLQIAILYDLIHGLQWQKAGRTLSW